MHIRIASFWVQSEHLEAFRAATLEHVRATQQEAGVQRFELLQETAEPAHFVILMTFTDDAARARHFEMDHFQRWRSLIQPLLREPIQSVQYARLSPA